jgi:hypothetical protein|tara:strand:- start:269 stop:661 length:393 start_codon:yes stop_codon:yes gene_type:complete
MKTEKTVKKTVRVKCHLCDKKMTVYQGTLDVGPYTCKDCFDKNGNGLRKFKVHWGSEGCWEIEILKFKAVAQEKSMKLCCYNKSKCGMDTHDIGDVLVFFDTDVRFADGKIVHYGTCHIIPPIEYWCVAP